MTRVLPLRGDPPPEDIVALIRAGLMSPDQVRRSAERTFAGYAIYGISVEGVTEGTVLAACRRSQRIAAYRQIRLSTFGRLRSAGFALLPTFDHPHFTVVLADLSELTIIRLDRCFDKPIPNPGYPCLG